MKYFRDLLGQQFGFLTVIGFDHKDLKTHGFCWLCRCTCGKYKVIKGGSLVSGRSTSCGCKKSFGISPPNKRKEYGETAFIALVTRYKRSAQTRGLEFNLTDAQIKNITSQSCHYCGKPPSQILHLPGSYGEYIYNGIDRVENGKGYLLDNCVPCCKYCNRAKDIMSKDDFKSWIISIYQNYIEKKNTYN